MATGLEGVRRPVARQSTTTGVVMDFLVFLLVVFLVFLVAGWGWRAMRR
jgi:hypothetical protein